MLDKYIELLLVGCLKVDEKTPLFISYDKISKDFVKKVQDYAKKMGVKDIYLDETDSDKLHDILKNSRKEELEHNKMFDASIWNEYAKKKAAFLMLTSEIPHLMDDVDSEKIAISSYLKRTSKNVYNEKQLRGEIPWCIACVPNSLWAKDLFPKEEDALNKFWQILAQLCMFDKGNPIKRWKEYIEKQEIIQNKLNDLRITKLYYKNKLGTDFTISLSPEHLWCSASSSKWLVNMPSYEIFTSPDYRTADGIVYSTKPLLYNGKLIDDFYVKFKDGKVVEVKAKKGEEDLKEIIASDDYSAYLGEVALVDYNSPISKTNIVFKTTLIDENASCHIALGSGFVECIKNGNKKDKEELKELGLNPSKNHVDFMIGSEDLTVEADTKDGHITIMKDGNLVI